MRRGWSIWFPFRFVGFWFLVPWQCWALYVWFCLDFLFVSLFLSPKVVWKWAKTRRRKKNEIEFYAPSHFSSFMVIGLVNVVIFDIVEWQINEFFMFFIFIKNKVKMFIFSCVLLWKIKMVLNKWDLSTEPFNIP